MNVGAESPEDYGGYYAWGENWRMPTYDEQTELRTKCYWVWTTSYNGKSVKGYIVYKQKSTADTGRTHGSSYSYSLSDTHIFLPAAGYRNNGSLYYGGSYGFIWSSSLNESNPSGAWSLFFGLGPGNYDYGVRYEGSSVRAVRRQ